MNRSSSPRQPFVGLSIFAATGIICADFFPLPGFAASIGAIGLIAALVLLRWPHLTSTYALVCAGFFFLHGLQITDTSGLRLATRLGAHSRVIGATGSVVSEPKIAPSGFATFLLNLSQQRLTRQATAPQTMHGSSIVTHRLLMRKTLP